MPTMPPTGVARGRRRQLGDAEVEQFDELGTAAQRAQEDVGRLEVAVDDPFFVRRLERVANLVDDVDHVAER